MKLEKKTYSEYTNGTNIDYNKVTPLEVTPLKITYLDKV